MISIQTKLVCMVSLAAASLGAQAPLAFEVASIKAAEPLSPDRMMSGQQRITAKVDPGQVSLRDLSLAELIRSAYRVKLYQISGPEFVSSARFDVTAKLPEGSSQDQVPEMLRTLLAQRFHLEFHNSTKEMAVYALVIGKDGAKLKESSDDGSSGSGGRDITGAGPMTSGPNGAAQMTRTPNGLHIDLQHMAISSMVDWLARFADRPVVDQTGLKARYDVPLEVSREEMMAAARGAGMVVEGDPGRRGGGDTPEVGDNLFTSVQRVGLRLEAKRLPVTLMVIDKIDRTPTEN